MNVKSKQIIKKVVQAKVVVDKPAPLLAKIQKDERRFFKEQYSEDKRRLFFT